MIEYVPPEMRQIGLNASVRMVPDRVYRVQVTPVYQRLDTGWRREFRLVKPDFRKN